MLLFAPKHLYCIFIDFDRLNYWLLFDKLIKKHVPLFIIKLLLYWYTPEYVCSMGQLNFTRFLVSNGVKQSRIIFLILFNIYMNDLSMHLNSSCIGGYLGTAFINNLCYVDDLCLISLSSSGMQQLLHVCNKYAVEHQLLYNGSKSFSSCFKRTLLKLIHHLFSLVNHTFQWSNSSTWKALFI